MSVASGRSRQPVITGAGIASSLGDDLAAVSESLAAGRSGIIAYPEWGEMGVASRIGGRLTPPAELAHAAGLPKRLRNAMSPAATYAAYAAVMALRDAGLTTAALEPSRTACIVGAGVGGVEAIHASASLARAGQAPRIQPYTLLMAMTSSTSAILATLLEIGGPTYSLSSACATSAHCIGHAADLIRSGVVDAAIAGGADDVNGLVAAAFGALRGALSIRFNQHPERASRPFDAQRDGFVLSGGAGVVLLESLATARARGARIRAELAGYAATSDGYDLVKPRPRGESAARCVSSALTAASVAPEDVDYVNAHAPGTPSGDRAEIHALRCVFGRRLPPLSSTKSMGGHAIGAAGAQEVIHCLAMLERGFVAPSVNVERVDPEFEDLPIVTRPLDMPMRLALSTSFGFGGTNAALVLRRFE